MIAHPGVGHPWGSKSGSTKYYYSELADSHVKHSNISRNHDKTALGITNVLFYDRLKIYLPSKFLPLNFRRVASGLSQNI